MQASIIAVARDGTHRFSKTPVAAITVLAGLGVEGDAHLGVTVQHRSRVAVNPDQPNLRQVHLIGQELLEELAVKGFDIAPGDLGENVTTKGIDLITLPQGTRLTLGQGVRLLVTGLRNPCPQIDAFRPGLLREVLGRDAKGGLIRKTGVMCVAEVGGDLRAGDPIRVELPPLPHLPLERV